MASVTSKPAQLPVEVVSSASIWANSGRRSLKTCAALRKMARRSATDVCSEQDEDEGGGGGCEGREEGQRQLSSQPQQGESSRLDAHSSRS